MENTDYTEKTSQIKYLVPCCNMTVKPVMLQHKGCQQIFAFSVILTSFDLSCFLELQIEFYHLETLGYG